jgi:hypothetical protein
MNTSAETIKTSVSLNFSISGFPPQSDAPGLF